MESHDHLAGIAFTWPLVCSGIAALFTLIGGTIPLAHQKLSKNALAVLLALSGGIMLSTSLNHMVRESFGSIGAISMVCVSFGFLLMYGLEKMTMVHACREQDCHVHHFGGMALMGIGFHSFLDGFAIGVSLEFNLTLGLMVVLAVLLHRLPDGIAIATVMLANRYSTRKAWGFLSMLAGLAVAGTIVGLASLFSGIELERFLSIAIGISAGTFIYIATSDLMPMAHEDPRDYRVPIAFIVGFLGILLTAFIYE
ncbi:MAG: ZIP family metal transporter [candidate division KSB1 bacterium]|nr:ZIP family metal transporter [candidate division KSB1 bacterium]MDZ7301586.1 ZIP family metal transporter [candidate division KSB1 bacterium]MDZ7310998.1 ZIP family metal transporter [candidate division KSB1 bacterium]